MYGRANLFLSVVLSHFNGSACPARFFVRVPPRSGYFNGLLSDMDASEGQ